MKFIVKLLILSFLVVVFNIKLVLAEDFDLDAGQAVFSNNCAACHTGGNNAIMPEKTLKIDALKENEISTVDAIIRQVTNGKNAMPAFGGRLSSDEIVNVANFVFNQATTDSW